MFGELVCGISVRGILPCAQSYGPPIESYAPAAPARGHRQGSRVINASTTKNRKKTPLLSRSGHDRSPHDRCGGLHPQLTSAPSDASQLLGSIGGFASVRR